MYNMNVEQSDRTMYEFIAEVRASFATIKEQLNTLIKKGDITDKKVDALEKAYSAMEVEVNEKRAEFEQVLDKRDGLLKIWMLKAIIGVTLIGSFVWIKESRDAIIGIISHII